jgi:hypothetical protein
MDFAFDIINNYIIDENSWMQCTALRASINPDKKISLKIINDCADDIDFYTELINIASKCYNLEISKNIIENMIENIDIIFKKISKHGKMNLDFIKYLVIKAENINKTIINYDGIAQNAVQNKNEKIALDIINWVIEKSRHTINFKKVATKATRRGYLTIINKCIEQDKFEIKDFNEIIENVIENDDSPLKSNYEIIKKIILIKLQFFAANMVIIL